MNAFPSTKSNSAGAAHVDGDSDLTSLLGASSTRAWYRRPALWFALLALLLAGVGSGWWYTSRAAKAAPSYATQEVTRGNLALLVTANGTIQPLRTIDIGSELSGTVLKVNVDVNDHIKKGQVLVELDTAKLRDQIVRSKSAVTSAKARVSQTTATIKEARAALARLEEVSRLSAGKVPSPAELDSGRATLERALADDESARAGVSEAQAALSTDQTNLSKASITAPSNGVVLTRAVDPGNAVAASLQAVTLFTVADDLSKLRLWVYVDEADVGSVKVGQDATFTVSAYPAREYPAVITRVGFGSTITENVVTYLTYLDVDNSDLSLRPGMTATATIIATRRKDALLVPNMALRFTPSSAMASVAPEQRGGITTILQPRMRGGGGGGARRPETKDPEPGSESAAKPNANAKQVWVLPNGSGAPVAVAVVVGISDGRMTEIVAGDLKPGMRVITNQKSAAK